MSVQTLTSKGVKITVTPSYYENEAVDLLSVFYFHYVMEIENRNPFSIQLLHRYWKVSESLHASRVVNGEGVIGQQPIIEPGESFQYTSGCELESMIGTMEGHYVFQNLNDMSTFKVSIPRFHLIFPGLLN
jgi:ApaG protein